MPSRYLLKSAYPEIASKGKVTITADLSNQIGQLRPGQTMVIHARDGRKFSVIDHEDFKYILEIAGMDTQDIPCR